MGVEILAQVVFDVTRHSNQNAPLKKQKRAAGETGSQDLHSRNSETSPANRGPILIDRATNN